MTERNGPGGRSVRPVAALLAATGLLAASFVAGAPAAGAASSLEVTAGYGGYHVPGRAVPVTVTVSADRLVRGDLVVRPPAGRSGPVSMPVEVPGGSVKRFVLVLPGGTTGSDRSLPVELRVGSQVLARGEARLKPADGDEIVALLPGALAGRPVPGPAPLAVDVGVARFAFLDPADIGRGVAVLDPLSAIGATPEEIAGLPPSARAALAGWMRDGGRLLVGAPAGFPMQGLPAEWQPAAAGAGAGGPAARAPHGRGEIRLVGDALAAGRWAGLVEPTGRGRTVDQQPFFGGESIANTVARDAGLRLPHLGTLLLFLGAYVVAVGPFTAVVLRRRGRPELAWVVIPLVAVLFTAGSWVAGGDTRTNARLAHATVLHMDGDDDTAMATTFVGLTRGRSGTARVGFPAGWLVQPPVSTEFDPSGRRTDTVPATELSPSGPEASIPLDVGQFRMVRARGPLPAGGRLVAAAAADGTDGMKGTVRNGFPFPLEDVAVFAGPGVATVGRLAPDEEKVWSLTAARLGRPVEDPFSGFPAGFGFGRRFPGPPDGDSAVNVALWQQARMDMGVDGAAPGTAMAVGWTRDHDTTVRVDGRERGVPGRTAIVARVAVAPGPGGGVAAGAVRREVVRGPFPSFFGWESSSSGDTVLRFTLPSGAPAAGTGELLLRSSVPLENVEVWRDGVWQTVAGGFAGRIVDGRGVLIQPLPAPVPTFEPGSTPPTTITVPPSPLDRSAPPATALAPDAAAPPPPAPPPPLRPMPAPDMPPGFDEFGNFTGVDASTGIAIPGGAVHDGVVFLRLRMQGFDGRPGGVSVTLEQRA